MNVSDAHTDSQWDHPRNEERRDPPVCYGNVRKNAYGYNCECNDTDQWLIENALKQHERKIAIHSRAEHGHGCRPGDKAPQCARKGRNQEFDDPRPHHRSRTHFPSANLVVRLQIHRQHDRKRVSDDGGNVVPVHMRRDVGARLAPSQLDRERRQSQRSDKKPKSVAGQKMRRAECQRNSEWNEQEYGDDHLGDIEADLRDGCIDIAASERPPSLCLMCPVVVRCQTLPLFRKKSARGLRS